MDNMVFNTDYSSMKPEPDMDFNNVDQENSTYYIDENLTVQYEMPKLDIPISVIYFVYRRLRLIYLKQCFNAFEE